MSHPLELYHHPEVYHGAHPDSERLGKWLKAWARSPVLDLGSGTGRGWADLPQDRVGIDGSFTMLGFHRKRMPDALVLQGNFQALPFQDQSFLTATWLMNGWIHGWRQSVLKEIFRCLKLGSLLLIEEGGLGDGRVRIGNAMFALETIPSFRSFLTGLKEAGFRYQGQVPLEPGFRLHRLLKP